MTTLISDLRYAVRKLARAPGFTAIAVVTLALGIGATTSIFSVVYGVLMRPLPFERPAELVRVLAVLQGQRTWANSATSYLELRERTEAFSGLAMYGTSGQTLTGRGDPEEIQAGAVSANFFEVLGMSMARGGGFAADANEPGRDDVVVLGWGWWQERFGGDPDVLGQTLVLNGQTRRVVGVAPRGFGYPDDARLWIPLEITPEMRTDQHGAFGWLVIGRLAPGVSLDRARDEVVAQARSVNERIPEMPPVSADVEPLLEAQVGGVRASLLMLFGAVALVLLIACANIANLLMARVTLRESEIAVRRALGAGSGRIVRQILVESVLLGLAGGVAGVLIALWATDALVALGPERLPRLGDIRVDAPVLLFTLAASLVTGLLFGLVPALQMARRDPGATLKAESRAVTGRGTRARSALVVAELALAVVLLAGAGLLINSLVRMARVDPGFEPRGVAAVQLWLPPADFPESADVAAFSEQVAQNIGALPGVRDAATTQFLPLEGAGFMLVGFDRDAPPATPAETRALHVRTVTDGFFRTAGVPLLQGRAFEATDRARSSLVAVVNEAAARQLFGDGDALGRSVELTWTREGDVNFTGTVVGVVADSRVSALAEEPQPIVYLSQSQMPTRRMQVIARTGGDPLLLADGIRREIHRLAPNIAVHVRRADYLLDNALAQARFYTIVLGVFAATALLLAAIGVFGVFSWLVTLRRREIGIRIALGAREATVVRMVVAGAGRLAALGVALGLLAALLLTRFVQAQLFGVSPTDPLTFLGAALLLGGVGLLASWIPARAAARLNPLDAIRPE
jgi:putative ABC transport system permease protein